MNFPEIFSAAALTDLIRGPLVWLSFGVCGSGLAVQIYRFLAMTQKVEIPRPPFQGSAVRPTLPARFKKAMIFLRVSVLGVSPCMTIVSFVFHSALIGTPFLVLGHNVLLDTAFGISFFSLSECTTDALTLVVLFCGGFLLARRILLRRVRMISSGSDFLLLAAAVGPFLTGFLAYHHIGVYSAMVTLHILSAEILLVMIPFSRFSHMIFFVVSRFLIVGEHSRKSARRVWRYQ